jgi:hypothetical protein
LPSSVDVDKEDEDFGAGGSLDDEDPVEDCETGSELLDAGVFSESLDTVAAECSDSLELDLAELEEFSLLEDVFSSCFVVLSGFAALLELDSTAGVSAAEDAGDSVPEGESPLQATNMEHRQRKRVAFFISVNRPFAYLLILM